ncbi:GNAT family N-acetyltransferase [Blastococcus sp. TBT05-19]|uniref:GNAT family N-acetyltransferase n=1 Tax=Blastococcus sp. TBT05-19 TaxID=2250581 RepID=UPI000DEAD629|nr:GNAT family N-acetyltransferase [Blastococcus sp. TBT05-19]RBY94456.1 GNAT family N-acetyltransferase [Blastococcus sp. TBT05-19]
MPALPAVFDGFTARPLSADDAAAVAELIVTAEPGDDTGEYPDPDDVADEWAGWKVDLGRDAVAVEAADGALVGYASVSALANIRDSFRVSLDGRVHPAHRGRGIGRALLDWQLARGAEVHAERHPEARATLVVGVLGTQPDLERLVAARNLTAERWYRSMERPLTDLPEEQQASGAELVPFTWDRDEEVRRTHNAAFTQHHGSSERDQESWQSLFTGQRSFRPDLSVLAVADGEVQGYVLAYVYESDARAKGYRETVLGQIGVLPGARGRGIASAMIVRALRSAADAGCARAALDVDSDNVTGALRLYEGLGFETVRTRVSWSTSLPPVAAD